MDHGRVPGRRHRSGLGDPESGPDGVPLSRVPRTAYDRCMRSTLVSLTSIGLLLLGCGDDASPGATTSTTGPDPSTSVGETTSEPDGTTGSSSDSGTDTASVDESSSTGPGIVCGDDVVEADEVCDGTALGDETCVSQGFDDGELSCAADCSGYDTRGCLTAVCGDGVAVGRELCDGSDTADATCRSEGFDSGTLACQDDCATFDTGGCGMCGNNQVDGAEACDGVWLQGADCFSQGFDSGTIGCAVDCQSYDTSACGLCGNDILDGTEICDGVDLGATTCEDLGFAGGMLGCVPACTFDVYGCGVVQYDVSAPVVAGGSANRFRGNGYAADSSGVLVEFDAYLNLPAACDVDFYVYEASMFGGPYTQVARTTINVGPGLDYYAAGLPLIPVTAGMYYVLGAASSCSVTHYWTSDGSFAGFDAGIGLFNVSHWDNAYPGPSDLYVPPNTGGLNTVYAQRVYFAD